MFFAGLDADDIGLDSFGEAGRDTRFEMAKRELGGGVWQNVAEVCLEMVEVRVMWMLPSKKSDAGGIQGVKFMLFEGDAVVGHVIAHECAPLDVGMLGSHAENNRHGSLRLVELDVNEVTFGCVFIGRKVGGAGQGPEVAGVGSIVSVDLEMRVVAHHLSSKGLKKLKGVGSCLFGSAKLGLNGMLFEGNFWVGDNGVGIIVIVIHGV